MAGHKPFRELVEKMSPKAQAEIERGTQTILAELELGELRRTLEVTQEDLARRLKTTQAALSRLETTNQNPKISTLEKYAEALGGELQVCVKLADQRTIRLKNLILGSHKKMETPIAAKAAKVRWGKKSHARP